MSEQRGYATERGASVPGGEGISGCVLVVEDELLVCHAITRLLRNWGYTTLEAQDGSAALDQVRTSGSRLSAILLDIMLPVMSGLEVARRVRMEWPDLPIVVCSAALNHAFEADLHELGVREILAKPFQAEALRATLHQATRMGN